MDDAQDQTFRSNGSVNQPIASDLCTSDDRVSLSIEVCQASTSGADPAMLKAHVTQYLNNRSFIYQDEDIRIPQGEEPFLEAHAESIRLCDTETDRQAPLGTRLLFWQVRCSVPPLIA